MRTGETLLREIELNGGTPEVGALRVIGEPRLLELPHLALLSARRIPPDLLLPTLDRCRLMREEAPSIIGGFQSPLERFALEILLRGRSPVVVCPARTLAGMRIPLRWRAHVAVGRMAVTSDLPERWRRPTTRSGELRNRLVTGLAARIFVVQASPGTRTFRLALESMDHGKVVECFAHPANRELMLVGAEPVPLEPRSTGSARAPGDLATGGAS